jgi:hypothetical protein
LGLDLDIKKLSGQSALKHGTNGALFIASICTFFDYLWNVWIPHEHAMIFGLLHGAVLFACLGGYLGMLKRSVKVAFKGMVGGVLCGFLAAGAFYMVFFPLLALIMAQKTAYILAMVFSWVAIWKLLANLTALLNGEGFRPWPSGWRGFFASIVSVPGFLVITQLWNDANDYNYILAYLAWTGAFLPAITVLLYRRPQTGDPEKWI